MRQAILAALVLFRLTSLARAQTVYEFVSTCRADDLGACFTQIEDHLDRLKTVEQGLSFCLPRAWGATMYESVGYPVSVLDHVRLGLSAARFGNAGRPADDVIKDIIGKVYPCN